MTRYDAVVIGAGLGGLTAGAILARGGRKVLVIERSNSVGGAASSYKAGDLFVEGSLHLTSDPKKPNDPKHRPLDRAGVLDAVEWVRIGSLYQVRGGPLSEPFDMPGDVTAAREALALRFPQHRAGIEKLLSEMEQLASTFGSGGLDAVLKLAPELPDWRASLGDKLRTLFGDDEMIKFALAGDLAYVHDDPATLWWVIFALMQGSLLTSGARFIQGGSQRLSSALARAIRKAGGEVLLRRAVKRIEIADGAHRVTHTARDGSDPQTVEATRLVGNAAPAALAALMPDAEAEQLTSNYASHTPSLSLFALSLGLAQPAQEFGLSNYVTQVLPDWMTTLGSYAQGKTVMAGEPGGRMPPLAIANYAAIESGVPSPPYVLSVVGPDLVANWDGLDQDGYRAKRGRWQQAIIAHLDAQFPGLAGAVTAASFNTALSVQQYLGVPDGAVYGFAPTPPQEGGTTYRSPRTALPGLYLASAWSGIGGYNGAIQAAEACADMILGEG